MSLWPRSIFPTPTPTPTHAPSHTGHFLPLSSQQSSVTICIWSNILHLHQIYIIHRWAVDYAMITFPPCVAFVFPGVVNSLLFYASLSNSPTGCLPKLQLPLSIFKHMQIDHFWILLEVILLDSSSSPLSCSFVDRLSSRPASWDLDSHPGIPGSWNVVFPCLLMNIIC